MRLSRFYRRLVYLTMGLLVATGIGWLVADWFKSQPDPDIWQHCAEWLNARLTWEYWQRAADWHKTNLNAEFWQRSVVIMLSVHGGAAMAMLLALGALAETHVRRSWRADRNRTTGVVMVLANACLIVTAFELYYSGSEAIRPWVSNIHLGFGLALPILVFVHVIVGRTGTRKRARTEAAAVIATRDSATASR